MRTVDAHRIENLLQMCGTYHGVIAYDTVISVLHDVPTVEPQRKKGRWKGEGLGDYRCSLCGQVTRHTRTNFCPNCGADMTGGDADE